ncbi:MAG: dockerin type I domain-containing protein [Phycisphaerae bacterium]|jgi:hypothetical protein
MDRQNNMYVLLMTGLTLALVGQACALEQPAGWSPAEAELAVTNNLAAAEKELIVETDEWKAIFSLYYNGGIYRLFDKVYDPCLTDNLVTGPWYSQGGIFDYDIYLLNSQEFMTTLGRNDDPARATLEILENTPVRLRVRQFCHPRLNNGDGPPGNPFPELDMVEATTEWTIYPTGRVNIKFDTKVPDDWDGIVSQGPGGSGKGINASGTTITAVNGTSFAEPWVTHGDMIESAAGGWGPIRIADRIGNSTLQLDSSAGSGTNLDFVIRRPYVTEETISIHADGDSSPEPHTSYWQGGSNGDVLYDNGGYGDKFRNTTPPVRYDYCYAHWTRSPRQFGSMLAFNENYAEATFAVFNDQSWEDISYTQVGRYGQFVYIEHHRHLMAHLGTENGQVLPRIKSVADALPLANDYRSPYAEARVGTLQSGEGFSNYGFNTASGAYHIIADANVAEIAFDSMRGGSTAYAYYQPAVVVSNFNAADNRIKIELSQDNGATFEELPSTWYNITSSTESTQLGGADIRLIQLLCPIPATATGANKWVLRLSKFADGDINKNGQVDFFDFAQFAQQWFETDCELCGGADLTGDGDVDANDLSALTKSWLAD